MNFFCNETAQDISYVVEAKNENAAEREAYGTLIAEYPKYENKVLEVRWFKNVAHNVWEEIV